jgi:type VI protein secretion system component Hcp
MVKTRNVVRAAAALALAVAATAAIATSQGANAAPAKPKPVVVGRLVLGDVTSDVTAYTWEVTAPSSFVAGGGASIGKPNPSAIQFTKAIDASSVPTLLKIAVGESFPSAVFTVTLGKGKDTATMVYELDTLLVTRVSQGSTEGVVTEELAFVFKAVTWRFTSAEGDVTTGTWDVPSGNAS